MDLKTSPLKRPSAGYALLLTAVAVVLATVLIHQLGDGYSARKSLRDSAKASQSQALARIRTALLAFAVSQGDNSLSQPGNLPCPSLSPEGAPQTTCLNVHVGYLPEISVIKTNYTRNTVPMLWNSEQLGHQKSWAYAVSPQVLQANALGWSQWVDFSLPGLTVIVDQTTYKDVVAVVAAQLTPLGNDVLQATGHSALLSKADLLQAIAKRRHFQIQQTIATWLAINHQTEPKPTENLQAVAGDLIPVDSQCQCHCTSTRCQCGCNQAAQWQTDSNPATPFYSDGTDTTLIAGPARLTSQWPISHYSPSPMPGSGCRPANPFTCPLAPAGKSCDCTFAWPTDALSPS
ncbi:hypothetical protein [Limnobacter litoralis]|uniref:DUF2134 domain-containing protein n=1 Tax=Limnobacter litoralis TaxID=481366 RepID=A0ABQ5YVA3_9BURK|nr:hypothetical protein [Limnobacter litoralis]GLR27381.1 hypothetical protein GCM10007875_24720 [Limnobacter litoralis]